MAYGQLLKFPQTRAYIFQADFDGAIFEIIEKYNLPVERGDELLQLIYAYLDGILPLAEVPDLIGQAFGVNDDKAKQIALALIGNLLLPLSNYLPGLETTVDGWGGNLGNYPSLRIERGTEVQGLAVKEAAVSIGIPLTDEFLKRLIFLLRQVANGEKTQESLKIYFERPPNIGGLGLTQDKAGALLAATLPLTSSLLDEPLATRTVDHVSSVSIPTSEIIAAETHALAAEVPVVSKPAPASKPAPKQELEVVPTHALVAEVPIVNQPKLKAVTPKAEVDHSELKLPAKKAALARKLTASSQDVFTSAITLATNQASAVLKKNKISDKVFADLADKAIRGVRDIYQTRDLAERDWHLKGQDLATLMVAITAGVDMYQSAPQVKLKDKSEKHALSEGEGIKVSEDKQLDARFAQITKGSVDTVIEPARTQLTVGSAVPKTPAGQRKMVDVMSTHRLAGPIEQLGKLSTTEFRRLSSSAAEAAQKIEDLLLALETTAYSERVKGVLAWRNSPMNQLYLHITEEALSQNLALPEVSSRRRAAGKDSLSPAEIKALALLNAKIRF